MWSRVKLSNPVCYLSAQQPEIRLRASSPPPTSSTRCSPPEPRGHMTDAFQYESLLPIGEDTTPYRRLTSDHVEVKQAFGKEFLEVAPEALRRLSAEAMRDIAHL